MSNSVAILIIILAVHGKTSPTSIDSAWWARANPETRRGAINGAFDCLTSERGIPLPRLPIPELTERVDKVLGQAGGTKTLADALRELPTQSNPPAPGGEDFSNERHGWFDGYYWGSAPDDERDGFLIGYLSCGGALAESPDRVRESRRKVDKWYENHPSSNAKISDVLSYAKEIERSK